LKKSSKQIHSNRSCTI